MPLLTSNQIQRLSREAKVIRREQSITHTAALDQQAQKFGFPTWALLKKAHSNNDQIYPSFQRSVDEMRQSFRKIGDSMTMEQGDELRSKMPDLSREYANPLSALRYAESYLETALSVPRYSPSGLSVACIEMRVYLPYTLEPIIGEDDLFILVGRDYKPLGMPQRDQRVKYEIYKNLHVRVPREELERVTRHRQYSPRYLYLVGPHSSRKYAEAYLKQLQAVTELIGRHL